MEKISKIYRGLDVHNIAFPYMVKNHATIMNALSLSSIKKQIYIKLSGSTSNYSTLTPFIRVVFVNWTARISFILICFLFLLTQSLKIKIKTLKGKFSLHKITLEFGK